MFALPIRLSAVSTCMRARCARAIARACVTVVAMAAAGTAWAQEPVKGTVSVFNENGYTRLLFRLDQEVPARINVAGSIMVISFRSPVQIAVERLNTSVPNYISIARRDPDGTAIRIALSRKVKVNTIRAAERLYIDLLPDDWTGLMPGLPQDVIDDLAKRARDAERITRQQGIRKDKPPALVRVKVARTPTFVRYVFPMPEATDVVPEQSGGKLRLNFDQAVKWDLADALATMPPTLEAIHADTEADSVVVTFALSGTPNVRTFREDRSFIVDVGTTASVAKQGEAPAAPKVQAAASPLAIDAPETMPASKSAMPAPDRIEIPKGEPLRPDIPPASAEKSKVEAEKNETVTLDAWKLAAQTMQPAPAAASKPEAPRAAAQNPAPMMPAQAAMPAPPSLPADAAPMTAPAMPPPVVPAVESTMPAAPAQPAPAPMAQAPAQAAAQPAPSSEPVTIVSTRQTRNTLHIDFPFLRPTPAAAFRRGDTLWLIFDTDTKLNIAALKPNRDMGVRSANVARGPDGETIVRVKFARPRLVSLAADGPVWNVTIGDTVTTPSEPVPINRSILGRSQANIAALFNAPVKLHTLRDPEVGDALMLVTGLAPPRGIPKRQDFVELHALETVHGIVVQPVADDVIAQLESDRVVFGRPGGLSLSPLTQAEEQIASTFRTLTFDPQTWLFDRKAAFGDRQSELIRLAASAPEGKRKQARLNLARFYLARNMAAEAKGVLDLALSEEHDSGDVTGSILRVIAKVMLGQPEDALKDLAVPQVAAHQDAAIWRGVAYARAGKWPQAREAFKVGENGIMTLPVDLQHIALMASAHSAIEVGDFAAAARYMNDLDASGVPADLKAPYTVLAGRLAEGLGRNDDAMNDYRAVAAGDDRRAAAQARLREISLMHEKGQMPRKEVITALETLTTVWRGDGTETEGLRLLAHLYTEENRFRDAFHVMRTALLAHPNSDMTRKIQDEAAATFDSLFLEGKGDMLAPVEALGLFYDYRELTPIGRRGDEMIRRLADRLVSVDLLDQAAELLQHQVDHRLQGAARAQVATRLAVVYLMNRKPDRALVTLQKTRSAELANELRDQRLLLEARSLSDIGRHDLALELIANLKGPEVIRLRADIMWAGKRWREAAEQIELLHGQRWRDFTPLTDAERTDILRAVIGYTLGDEPIGLARLREKYSAKMAGSADETTFKTMTAPEGVSEADFQDIAKRLAGVDTLQGFLSDIRKRYPESAPPPPGQNGIAPKPEAAGSAPNNGAEPANASGPANAPAGAPPRIDNAPTGSIGSRPRAIAR